MHRTQWAAQFAVASELCKKGYEVAFTMGNHPSVDLLAISPGGTAFTVDVKGLYKKNWWAVKSKPDKVDLFYIFAFVPDYESNRFFILDQTQVNSEIEAEFERARLRARAKGRGEEKVEAFPGVGWKFAEQFENAWGRLPP